MCVLSVRSHVSHYGMFVAKSDCAVHRVTALDFRNSVQVNYVARLVSHADNYRRSFRATLKAASRVIVIALSRRERAGGLRLLQVVLQAPSSSIRLVAIVHVVLKSVAADNYWSFRATQR